MRVFRFAIFPIAVSCLAAAPARDADVSRAQAGLARLPLRFEANLGQWTPGVRYAAHAGAFTAWFTAAGPRLSFPGGGRIDLSLAGSNPSPEIEGLEAASTRVDYFLGSRDRWRAQVPNYSRIRYRSVYPGVDAIYYGNQNRLEYDFRIAPGADPRAIRMRFRGAGRVDLTPDGDLLVESPAGRLLQKKPYIYQEDPQSGARTEIAGGYMRLANGAVGLRIARYDRTRPLIVDPLLVLSTYVGGTGVDQVNAVKMGPNGRLYIVGNTNTSDLSAPNGYAQANAADGSADIFLIVASMNASGGYNQEYVSYLGGPSDDIPAAIDVDAAGFVYITGTTTSATFPMGGTPVQAEPLGTTYNAFVLKLDPSASGVDSLWYGTFLGGTDKDWGKGIAVDGNGMIYVIGTTESTDFPVTDSAYAAVLYGTRDAFICEIDPNSGTLVYSSYLGSEAQDDARDIAIAPNGQVYFAITTNGTLFPLAAAPYRSTLQGFTDTVVGVMDLTKSGADALVYDTYFGGSDLDEARKIAVDAKGRLLVTGFTFSPDFPITPDAVQGTPGGSGDVFVSVLDFSQPANPVVYSTFLGGSQSEVAYGIAGDAAGSIYLAGYTLSSDFPTTPDAPQPQYGDGIDVFVAKLKPGTPGRSGLQFSTFLGGTGIHVATGVALGPDGEVFAGGYTSLGMPAAGAAAQAYFGGVTDGFLLTLTDLAGQPVRLQNPERRPASHGVRY